ncbi:MAG TPA: hypothetical protein PK655_03670 [archaeon]|jgi:hypothetical protein|nr:hypothetical protein [archaeon]HPV66518.1 hypothetical protein [archaeon]
MNKKVVIVYSKDVEKTLEYLIATKENNKINKSIYNSFMSKLELIKNNPTCGDKIPQIKIPKEYISNYKINNLFRLELANYWRCLYSLVGENNKIEIIAFVIDCIDHNKYNKKFKYK